MRTSQISGANGKFLGLFGLYLGIIIVIAQLSPSLYDDASRFTALATAAFWKIFFLPVSSLETNITFFDFEMEIIFECTGLHYAALFGAAVLASRDRTIRDKATGLLAGLGAIFLLNLLRLGMLGIIGHFAPRVFTFAHLYLWHALFTLIVLLLWDRWVNGKISISEPFFFQMTVSAAAASLAFWILLANIEFYFTILAYIADGIFPRFGGVLLMPRIVIAQGELIGYVVGDYVIYSKTGLYVLNWAVYVALAAGTAVRSVDRKLLVKRFAVGACLMFLSHLFLLFMDWSLEVTTSDVLNSFLSWGIVMSSMIAPLVVWGIIHLLYRSRNSDRNDAET